MKLRTESWKLNKEMKKAILISLLLLAECAMVVAQPQQHGKFNPEEFKAKLEAYITGEAGFTQAEAQAFFPIYFEMKGKQRQLQRRIYRLKKNAPAADADDKEYALVVQKINDLGVEMAQLGVTYYKTMCKAVSPRKVYTAMLAEDQFHRKMLEEFGHGENRKREQKPKQDK